MRRRELSLIVIAALGGYALLCKERDRGGRIPAEVIALDEPALFQLAVRHGADFL